MLCGRKQSTNTSAEMDTLLLVAAVSALLLVCVYVFVIPGSPSGVPMVPGDLPLLGHTLLVYKWRFRPLQLMQDLVDRYRLQAYGMRILGLPGAVFSADPAVLEHVLKGNFDNFPKGPFFVDSLHGLLGDGIFNVDGARWRVQRKTASHLFKMRELRTFMTAVFRKHTRAVIRILDAAGPDTPVDMHDLFHRFTLDSIGEIAFGLNLHTLSEAEGVDEGEDENGETLLTRARCLEFARMFDTAQEAVEKRFYMPHWKLLRLLRVGSEGTLRNALAILDSFCHDVIRERRRLESAELVKRADLLSLFLGQDGAAVGTTPDKLSDKELRDIILNFMIAGRDTTAQALSWLHYMIHKNPHVGERLADEARSVLGDEDTVDYHQARELVFTEASVLETLRLYPSVPKNLKTARTDDVLPGGAKIPKGGLLVYSPYVMGRLEELWDEPLSFLPERWIDAERPTPFKFPAFQAGPRTCLGKHVALLEAKIITSALSKRFSFHLLPGHRVEHRSGLTLPMKYGLKMFARPRPSQQA